MAHKLGLNFPFPIVTIFMNVRSCVFTTPIAYWKLKDFQSYAGQPHFVKKYSRNPLIRTLVIRNANYLDRLGPSCKYVENSIQLTCRESTGYRIKYSAVLWLLQLQIRRGRKVYTHVHTLIVTAELQTASAAYFQRNIQLSVFSAYPDGSPSQLIRISGVL